ncbi:DUF4352 domain-containing protein [Streptosporangium sp. OZ121]|uniref:DUF4352 domain-containing protein n=1 Tax=Streptosporangium sp. OZ121 TaxID=3444183 RepID=UPI003F79ADB2
MANQYGPQDPHQRPYGQPPPPQNGYSQQHQQPYGQPYPPPGHGYEQPYGQPYPPPGRGYGYAEPPRKPSKGTAFWLLVACAPILLLFGCVAAVVSVSDDTTVTTRKDRPTAAHSAPVAETEAETEKAPTQEPESKPSTATVGGTITLRGIESDLQVAVTLEKVVENATPKVDFFKPKDGSRFFAVQLTLKNTGQQAYSDSPSNGAMLIDTEGQQYRSTFGDIQEGVSFAGSVTMSSGDSRKGVIVFEVPKTTKIEKLQFALNSGFADHTGEWLTK